MEDFNVSAFFAQQRQRRCAVDSPARCTLTYNPEFVKELTEALCLLRENMELRCKIYKDKADDSRLGHTPLETRARFDSAEHSELRSSMKNHHPSTPDDATPPIYSSSAL